MYHWQTIMANTVQQQKNKPGRRVSDVGKTTGRCSKCDMLKVGKLLAEKKINWKKN